MQLFPWKHEATNTDLNGLTESNIEDYVIRNRKVDSFLVGHGLEENITISFVGDLKYGRTVHSLSKMLRHFSNAKINFVAPEEIQITEKYFNEESGDRKFYELTDEILETSDIIYDTRIQKERFEDLEIYEKNKNAFHFDVTKVNKMKKDSILMHPLPRINEISPEVDDLPQAMYFEQAANGVPTRMALIAYVLELKV